MELPLLGSSTFSKLRDLYFAIEELFCVFPSDGIFATGGSNSHGNNGNVLSSNSVSRGEFHIQLGNSSTDGQVSVFLEHIVVVRSGGESAGNSISLDIAFVSVKELFSVKNVFSE